MLFSGSDFTPLVKYHIPGRAVSVIVGQDGESKLVVIEGMASDDAQIFQGDGIHLIEGNQHIAPHLLDVL